MTRRKPMGGSQGLRTENAGRRLGLSLDVALVRGTKRAMLGVTSPLGHPLLDKRPVVLWLGSRRQR